MDSWNCNFQLNPQLSVQSCTEYTTNCKLEALTCNSTLESYLCYCFIPSVCACSFAIISNWCQTYLVVILKLHALVEYDTVEAAEKAVSLKHEISRIVFSFFFVSV